MAHMVTIKDLEERSEGTYYKGPLEPAKDFMREDWGVSESSYMADGKRMYLVCFTIGQGLASLANCNDFGRADTLEDAWRYALGAEFGPADDNFSAFPLTHDKSEATRAMVAHHFPERLDAFYSPTTGLAAVEDKDGNMWRVWPDGNIEIYRR